MTAPYHYTPIATYGWRRSDVALRLRGRTLCGLEATADVGIVNAASVYDSPEELENDCPHCVALARRAFGEESNESEVDDG